MRRLMRQVRARTGLDPIDAAVLADSLVRRSPKLSWAPNLAAVLGFVGWITVVTIVVSLLEGTPLDLAALGLHLGPLAPIAAIFLGGGLALLIGIVAFDRVQCALADTELRRLVAAAECPYRGYDRRGLPAADPPPRCPECGKHGLPSRSANCRRCGYPLHGVPAPNGRPRCPECGATDNLLGPREATFRQGA